MIQSEAEAKLFFDWNEDEYHGDVFVKKLFEFKTFFITKPPIKKIFLSKLNKLEKMVEAYYFLLKIEPLQLDEIQIEKIDFFYNWHTDFNLLQQQRSFFKQQIFKFNNVNTIRKLIESWMNLEVIYQTIYGSVIEKTVTDKITASVEHDPMELLEILKIENENTPLSLSFLKNNTEDLPKLLVNELKRLNLLFKLQSHE